LNKHNGDDSPQSFQRNFVACTYEYVIYPCVLRATFTVSFIAVFFMCRDVIT